MEIMNLKKFHEKKENKDISLYLSYLEETKKELKERLDDVLLLGLSNSVVDDISSQIKFIDGLESVISNSYKDLLASSLDVLSEKELGDMGEEYLAIRFNKQRELQKELDKKVNERDLAIKASQETFMKHGYKDEFYEANDTDVFFKEINSAQFYVKKLIKSDMEINELSKLFSLDCGIIPYSSELADMIIKLRKIVKVAKSDRTLDEVVNSFLSLDGMGKIIKACSSNECMDLFEKLQKHVKLNTDFFKALPSNLRASITEEDFDEEGVYGSLLRIYTDYKENGKVIMPEGAYDKSYDEEIKSLEEKLSEVSKEINDLRNIIADRKTFIEYIRNNIIECEEDVLSLKSIEKYIAKRTSAKEELEGKIREIDEEIKDARAIIYDIDNVISDHAKRDFEIIRARIDLRMMNILGEPATEEGVYPNYVAEKRRLEQYQIIVETIKELNDIKRQIEEVDNSRNLFKNLSGTNKKVRAELITQYRKVCSECYKKLKEMNLLRVVVSDSLSEQERERLYQPDSFDKIFDGGTTPNYQVSDASYSEFLLREIIPKNMKKEDLEKMFSESYALGKALFTAKQNEEGIFEFALSDELMDASIVMQEYIAGLYKELYEKRKANHEEIIQVSQFNISDKMKKILERLKISEGEASLSVIQDHEVKLKNKIEDLRKEKEQLQISLNEAKNFANGATLEDVEAYYSMLEGFYESVVSSEEVKKQIRA